MDLRLIRKEFRADGIFGQIVDENFQFICVSLEHAYAQLDGTFIPKVAPGTYKCVRHDSNRLSYETFMLKNVPPFMGKEVTGILIHILNFNEESEGCIGPGEQIGHKLDKGWMIMDSKKAFEKIMSLQKDVNEFTLVIE